MRLIIAVVDRQHPLIWSEQMMPIMPVVRVADVNEAIQTTKTASRGPKAGTSALHLAVENGHFELAIARDVQGRLFPERTPYAPFLEASGLCVPARTVSGDYYDVFRLEKDKLGIAVCDVAGKGMGASLIMASAKAATSPGFTRTPVTFARTASGIAPTVDETTGRPKERASTFVNPKPSAWLGITNASAAG